MLLDSAGCPEETKLSGPAKSMEAQFAVGACSIANTEIKDLQVRALESFRTLGIPTPKVESWKYTNLSVLSRSRFQKPSARPSNERVAQAIAHLISAKLAHLHLVFVDGVHVPELSHTALKDASLSLYSFRQIFGTGDSGARDLLEKVESNLATVAELGDNSLVALNTAQFGDGQMIVIGKDNQVYNPIQLIFVNSAEEGSVSHNRVLVLAEPGSQSTIVETHIGLSNGKSFNTTVCEYILDSHAAVDHYKVQIEGSETIHFGHTAARVGAGAIFRSHSFNFGGKIVRNEIFPLLDAPDIECVMNGLSVVDGTQHVDNTTVLDHAKPHCHSHELFKGVYAGKSTGAFSGTIIVRQDAQKTNAIQANNSLLLSEESSVDSRPQLKIWADDVKCTHGATVGQLDEEALFYIRSRGVPFHEAKSMLVRAFASDVISGVKPENLKHYLQNLLSQKLDQISSTLS